MDLLAISDIHGHHSQLESILAGEPPADVLILGGDLTNFGTPDGAGEILDKARNHTERVLAVAGNCDSAEIDSFLSREGVSVHAEGTRVEDVGFFGVSAMPPWRSSMYHFTEEEIDTYLEAGHSQVAECDRKVMVSHTPPHDSGVDETPTGDLAGSTSVRKWVEQEEVDLVICGHVHEARGTGRIGKTVVVNTGPARDGYYARILLGEKEETEVELLRATELRG